MVSLSILHLKGQAKIEAGLSHLEIAGWLECSSKLSPVPLCSCPQLNTFIVHQLRIGCMIHPSASLKTLKVNLYGFDASVTDLPANEKEEVCHF